ncbi:MAG: hypothetical protein PHT88_03630 [Candidatus Moranbacteria bacterium]|nr:hypothetical protein [Candidatus Moranbacteria bacterium]
MQVALPNVEGNVPETEFVSVKGFESFESVANFVDHTVAPLMKISYSEDQHIPSVLLNAYAVSESILFSLAKYFSTDIESIRMME